MISNINQSNEKLKVMEIEWENEERIISGRGFGRMVFMLRRLL